MTEPGHRRFAYDAEESDVAKSHPPVFDEQFRKQFARLLAWRRDVRRFRTDAIPADLIAELLDLAQLAPSVGNSQPWRWVCVESSQARNAVQENFARCNAQALASYTADRAALYARLKLEGLKNAPVQFAVFCDRATDQGRYLGRATIPRTLEYSVVGMLSTFWLAARTVGLGVGWVSILDPELIASSLEVPPEWEFIAYLCVGWPEEEHIDPELVRYGWQERTLAGRAVLVR